MEDPSQIQHRFGGHSIDIIATLLTKSPEFERQENDKNNVVWGLARVACFGKDSRTCKILRSKRDRGP